jgi:tetratricopeptide (TPR) repeat protein
MEQKNEEEMTQYFINQAKASESAGDLVRAAALLTQAAILDSDSENFDLYEYIYNIAENLYYYNNYVLSLTLFNFLRTHYDEHVILIDNILFYIGLSLIKLGEVDQGEASLRAGIEIFDDDGHKKRTYGYFLLSQEKIKEAIDIFTEVLDDIDEEAEEIFEAISWTFLKQHRHEDALHYLLDTLDTFHGTSAAKVYFRLLTLLEEQPAIIAVAKIIGRVIGLMKKMLDSIDEEYIYAGDEYFSYQDVLQEALVYLARRSGKKEEALSLLDSTWKENPDSSSILIGLARGYIEFEQATKALEITERARSLDPENPEVLIVSAKAELALGNYKEAYEKAQEAWDKISNKNNKYIYSTPMKKEFFDPPKFDELDKKVQNRNLDLQADIYLTLVDALSGMGKYEQALDTLHKARTAYPKELIFYRYIATLLYKIGNTKEALKHLSTARKQKIKLDKPTLDLERKIKKEIVNNA